MMVSWFAESVILTVKLSLADVIATSFSQIKPTESDL